jgi:hypothetical protein
MSRHPDFSYLRKQLNLSMDPVGLYDAPDPEMFRPLVRPEKGDCVFSFFKDWREGRTLYLARDRFGCGGVGRAFFGLQMRSHEDFITFLVEHEGLKSTKVLMEQWIEANPPYQPEYGHILIGPVRLGMDEFLRTVTIFVNPDQLAALMIGAQYNSRPTDPPPVIAPFGSGCMGLLPFPDLSIMQASIGATDIAMRQYLPADIMALSLTVPMYGQLCSLDEKSFLNKPFLERLRKSRGGFLS